MGALTPEFDAYVANCVFERQAVFTAELPQEAPSALAETTSARTVAMPPAKLIARESCCRLR
jgi:hypothetical protein